ncbi:MAG: YigZ family protein [Candidatus Izemoplasmataceae bacterium]|jgi:uncharacterized YigZ family protein
MKSIKESIKQTIEIKRSLFHTFLFPVNDLETIQNHLNILRNQYGDASHHCTAYILGDHQEIQKYDDDGEPSGTAGLPILEVLKKHELTNVLCVVIRYYGGIKLGAGGLVRAYTKGVSDALKTTVFTYLETVVHFEIHATFNLGGKLETLIREETEFIEALYLDHIVFKAEIKSSDYNAFCIKLSDVSHGQLKPEVTYEYKRYV